MAWSQMLQSRPTIMAGYSEKSAKSAGTVPWRFFFLRLSARGLLVTGTG